MEKATKTVHDSDAFVFSFFFFDVKKRGGDFFRSMLFFFLVRASPSLPAALTKVEFPPIPADALCNGDDHTISGMDTEDRARQGNRKQNKTSKFTLTL